MFRRILVCLDRSSFSEQILPFVCDEARKYSSKLVLLHVCTKNISGVAIPVSEPISFIPVNLMAKEFEVRFYHARQYLRNVTAKLEREGMDVSMVLASGMASDVADIIAEYVEGNGVDLVAMATHGRRGLRRLIFGSVADSVAGKCSVPMLTVKPGKVVSNNKVSQFITQNDLDSLFGLSVDY